MFYFIASWNYYCIIRLDFFYHGRLDWEPNSTSGRYVREMCKPLFVSRAWSVNLSNNLQYSPGDPLAPSQPFSSQDLALSLMI